MSPIRHAIDIAPLGDLADPRPIVRLAETAEASGWDGLSIWDSFGISMGTSAVDPFVALAIGGLGEGLAFLNGFRDQTPHQIQFPSRLLQSPPSFLAGCIHQRFPI